MMLSDIGEKLFRDGTHRTVSPTDTLQRVLPLLGALGITRIANVTGLDHIGIPVAVAIRPNSKSLSVSQGKGLTLQAAKVSAIMESVEAYHAENIQLPLRFVSYDSLRSTDSVIDVTQLPSVPGSRFNQHLRLLWIQGFDLITEQQTWVPYELVSTDCTLPFPSGSGCFQSTSNGLASGNHLLEAVSHGICEVVERDAAALWNGLSNDLRQRTRVDLRTINDPRCQELLSTYKRAEVSVAVWNQTSDIGMPVFTCLISDYEDNPFHFSYSAWGSGCHPCRSVALLRALTEAAQSRLTLITGSRDDILPSRYHEVRSQKHSRHVREIIAPTNYAGVNFEAIPSFEASTFQEDFLWERDCLQDAKIQQIILVNLTNPTIGLPVVRILLPGLEGASGLPDYLAGKRARAVAGF